MTESTWKWPRYADENRKRRCRSQLFLLAARVLNRTISGKSPGESRAERTAPPSVSPLSSPLNIWKVLDHRVVVLMDPAKVNHEVDPLRVNRTREKRFVDCLAHLMEEKWSP